MANAPPLKKVHISFQRGCKNTQHEPFMKIAVIFHIITPILVKSWGYLFSSTLKRTDSVL